MDWAELANESVVKIRPYVPGKPIEELGREQGWTDLSTVVKLASNENPLGPSPRAAAAVHQAVPQLHRYPESGAYYLRERLSAQLGVAPEQLVFGNGSNEVLVMIGNAFLRPGLEALTGQYAFLVYGLVAALCGATFKEAPARDYGFDLDAIADAITERTRVVFVANPNNPTGTRVRRAELERFLARVPEHVIVVLDEAYFEYVEDREYPNGVNYLGGPARVVVTRTFSKIYGLAGLRIGYGVMPAEAALVLERARQPFNINSLAQAAATAALDDWEHVERSVRVNRQGKTQLHEGMERLGLKVVPSWTNFLLVHIGEAQRVSDALMNKGVIGRPLANYALPEFLRFTIGTPPENERLLAALAEVL